jgi:nucleotide-binding universal stress UspA family protein
MLTHADMPVRHILVPVDLGGRAERAVRVARELAGAVGARTTLLHVVEEVPGIATGELRAFYTQLARRAARRLDHLARAFARGGLRVRTRVVVGRPASEIIRAVARERVDLIVRASPRVRAARGPRGLGTVSYRVGVASPCSVLLVK